MPSSTKCFAVVMTIMVMTSSIACGTRYNPRATAASPVQKLTSRSLLDLLMGGSSLSSLFSGSDEKPAASSSSLIDKQSSPLMDLVSSLSGKGDGNSALYFKLFKLLLNLVMDVMMDRMGSDTREDTAKIMNPLTPFFLRNRQVVQVPSSQTLKQLLESGSFKPYFIN